MLVFTNVVILALLTKFGDEGVVKDGCVEGRETDRKEYAGIFRERNAEDSRW